MTSGTRPGGGRRTTVDDRGKPSRAKPDERGSSPSAIDLRGRGSSEEVFPTTHKSGHKRCTAEFTTMPKCNDNSERVVLGDTGPRAANTWVSTWTGEQLVETVQALDEPRHHSSAVQRRIIPRDDEHE